MRTKHGWWCGCATCCIEAFTSNLANSFYVGPTYAVTDAPGSYRVTKVDHDAGTVTIGNFEKAKERLQRAYKEAFTPETPTRQPCWAHYTGDHGLTCSCNAL